MILTVPAPAKINLFLHVLGRREDGYHRLQTVFQFLDRCDEIRLTSRADGRIVRISALPGVEPEDDLTVRAARRLAREAGAGAGVGIEIVKRIPMGGGLGGGSSDAAAILAGLDRLWDLGLSTADLARIGLELGADVPVFVHGRAAWGEGVGEHLIPIDLETPWYAVVTPDCAVETARVFAHPALTRHTPEMRIRDFLRGGPSAGHGPFDVTSILERTGNDCEPVVRALHPEVDAAIDWLSRRGAARMTGTGASVFAPFASARRARAALEGLPARWQGIAARGLNSSPLLGHTREPESDRVEHFGSDGV